MTRLMKKQRVIITNDGISTKYSVIRTVRVVKESDEQGATGGQVQINNQTYLVELKKNDVAWYGQ